YFVRPHGASPLTRWLLRHCDWEKWAARRREHAERYAKGLDPFAFRPFSGRFVVGSGPFAYPVILSDRDDFRRHLALHKIAGSVLTTHWDFIPREDRARHSASVAVLKNHFLFPTAQGLTGNEIER